MLKVIPPLLGAALLAAPPAWSKPAESVSDVLDAAAGADVVIVGEIHDNPNHHVTQADIVSTLSPAAVVFEMLGPEQAETVNTSDLSGASLGEALGWAESGWPPFEMYAPIFDAAGDAVVYGAALPRDRVMAVMKAGLSDALGADTARFGLDRPLDETEQATREQGQMTAHCNALPEDMLPAMVAGQRLKDAAFARTTLQALEETGGPVVVITGNGHARTDWGMPRYLKRGKPGVSILSVGQIESGGPDTAFPPFDLWLVTEAADRGDPCAAFEQG